MKDTMRHKLVILILSILIAIFASLLLRYFYEKDLIKKYSKEYLTLVGNSRNQFDDTLKEFLDYSSKQTDYSVSVFSRENTNTLDPYYLYTLNKDIDTKLGAAEEYLLQINKEIVNFSSKFEKEVFIFSFKNKDILKLKLGKALLAIESLEVYKKDLTKLLEVFETESSQVDLRRGNNTSAEYLERLDKFIVLTEKYSNELANLKSRFNSIPSLVKIIDAFLLEFDTLAKSLELNGEGYVLFEQKKDAEASVKFAESKKLFSELSTNMTNWNDANILWVQEIKSIIFDK